MNFLSFFKTFKSLKVEVLGIMLFTFYGGSDSSWAPSYDTHAYFRSAIVLHNYSLWFFPQKLLSFSLRKQNHRGTYLHLLNNGNLHDKKFHKKKKIHSCESKSMYHCISFPIFDVAISKFDKLNLTQHVSLTGDSSIIGKRWVMC